MGKQFISQNIEDERETLIEIVFLKSYNISKIYLKEKIREINYSRTYNNTHGNNWSCCCFRQSIPFSDSALLIPIQTTMIVGLYKANGYNISQGVVTGALKSTLISGFGKAAAGNLLKFIPVVGSVAGGLINAGVAVAFTEALGFSVAHELKGSENADIIDLATVISNTMKSFKKK